MYASSLGAADLVIKALRDVLDDSGFKVPSSNAYRARISAVKRLRLYVVVCLIAVAIQINDQVYMDIV